MDKPLTVLLVEDEPSECQEIITYIEAGDDSIQLVGVTNNTIKAMQYVNDCLPEAIILDLELHKGQGNGLSFLSSLQEQDVRQPIYVLVTTNNISHVTHESARKLGADFIMVKSQENYSAKDPIDFLRTLKNVIQGARRSSAEAQPEAAEPAEQRQQRQLRRVITELDRIGIPPNAIGRKYLIDSIVLLSEGQDVSVRRVLSTKYGKTEASIERAMQNAIEKAWKTSAIDDLLSFYTARINSVRGTPTVMEFIYYYAEKIRNEY